MNKGENYDHILINDLIDMANHAGNSLKSCAYPTPLFLLSTLQTLVSLQIDILKIIEIKVPEHGTNLTKCMEDNMASVIVDAASSIYEQIYNQIKFLSEEIK